MVIFPVLVAYARSQGAEILRIPEVIGAGNSQTMSLLAGYLNINPTGIGGAELAIVDGVALESNSREGEFFVDLGKSGTGQISVYTVRKGDTLSEIADMFDVSVNTVIWANDLRGSRIKEGQELVILPLSGVRHIVKSGDTIASLAKKYKANQDDIISYNGLSSNAKLAVGDEIIIPDGEMTSSSGSTSNIVTKVVSGFKEYVGFYLRPIVGGKRSQGLHGHNAIDLAAPIGTPIVAAADGTVVVSRKSGYNGGYGVYIVISHSNGTQTVYAHMSTNNVSVGQQVAQGQVVGAIGMTGNTTGPHVHFEIRGARNPF